MGAWEITIFPQGADQMTKPEKKIIVSTGLVEIVRQYPDTMEAHFLGCGECLIPCPDSKEE